MAIEDGQGDLDTVVLSLVGGKKTEVKFWDRYSCTSRYLTPCDAFEFSIGGDDLSVADTLLPGAKVAITINGKPVLTGAIDKRGTASARGSGTVLTISGRDILGSVVSSNVDPSFSFSDSLTVLDVAAAVLNPFGITKVYNDGGLNVNAMTGSKQTSKPATVTSSIQLPKSKLNADGSISKVFETATIDEVGSQESLKSLTLQQLKSHFGEGAYQYLQRVTSRFGRHISAAADGSGVVIDEPDFTSAPKYKLFRSKSDGTSNIIDSHVEYDLDSQPSSIFAQGVAAAGGTDAKSTLQIIMVNEVVGVDTDGNYLPEVQNVISRYPGAKVLELRSELKPMRKAFNDTLVCRPMFLKDDESRTSDQLEGFVRRRMAEHQHKALVAHYTVEGHTQNGVPWAINTMVDVQDEVSGVTEKLWIMERTFEKSRSTGSLTHITCVRPYTIELGKARRAGGSKKNKNTI